MFEETGVVASMPRFSPFSIEAMGNVYGPRRTPSTENRPPEVIASVDRRSAGVEAVGVVRQEHLSSGQARAAERQAIC